ncbi:MAG: hypothetical protein HC939_23590 [Pleurocapsa sp. SU_5_0]|nr:hypothetical protein [Pleurocapsa sp. SU_5_0]NJR48077.1 hypothetical protein [Hyellaceae cyanobacterium CSU_1_1]
MAILIYGTLTTLIPASAASLIAIALLNHQGNTAILLGDSLVTYIVILLILIGIWERAVRRKLMMRQEVLPQMPASAFGKLILAIPATQFILAIALWQTVLTRQVEWRGITYQIKGPWDIKLLEYFPYRYLKRTNPKTSL